MLNDESAKFFVKQKYFPMIYIEKLKIMFCIYQTLPKKEIEVRAAEYDKLEEKKKQILEAPTPKPIKRSTKKVIEDEEEEEEVEQPKAVKKVTINKNNNNSLEENVSMLSIQQKLKLERQKILMSALTPMG